MGEWREQEMERLVRAVEHPRKAVDALSSVIATLSCKVQDAKDNNSVTLAGLEEAHTLFRNMRYDTLREYGVISTSEGDE